MRALFISDLHLATHTPQILNACLALLEEQADAFDRLYILGDLFDFWLGDDAIEPAIQPLISRLRQLRQAGKSLYFAQGNRDFLVGEEFARQSGCELLPDTCVIDLNGTRTLLMHGDLLCTDDVEYLKFRAYVRDPERQKQFLALPLPVRIEQARATRTQIQEASRTKDQDIVDANEATVVDFMQRHQVTRLIHGHTHRPAVHSLQIGNEAAQRIVIGDWHHGTSFLLFDDNGYQLHDPRLGVIMGK